MRVLVFEDNLMWSARLKKSLAALGHEALVLTSIPESLPAGAAAIVNVGSASINARVLIPRLRETGIYVIAHAGHKEKELRELAKELGCDRLASNSELTFKLDKLLPTAP